MKLVENSKGLIQTPISVPQAKDLRVLVLRKKISWMGRYSGYDRLFSLLNQNQPGFLTSVWEPELSHCRSISKVLKFMGRASSPCYSGSSAKAELASFLHYQYQKPNLIHVAYVELTLGLLTKGLIGTKIVGTFHFPKLAWEWFGGMKEMASKLDGAIVLSTQLKRELSPYFDGDKIRFIRHGVDTDFFCPLECPDLISHSPRFAYVGRWLRDERLLTEVVLKLTNRVPHVHFDLVVPTVDRKNISELKRLSNVQFYEKLSDEELRSIYRKASALLLPLKDTAANNAITEAVSCGLPIITTDVGGVSDYVAGDFAEVFPLASAAEGMVEAASNLVKYPSLRVARTRAARRFAVSLLDWRIIAEQTLEFYEQITNG